MKFLSHDGLMYFWTSVKSYIDTKYNELFQSVSNGKSKVASAITDKGVATGATATFDTMASNISKISTGVETYDATAVETDVLSGKTFYKDNVKKTGNIPIQGEPNATKSYLYNNHVYFGTPKGYFSGGDFSNVKETYANVANTIGLTANKILQGNTILGIAGTGKTESDVLNFPLSIQDAQPTPIRNGHIWIKSSTLASQITSATIQESLNAGAANNSLQFVVGESATSYLWLQNRDKKLTSGGNYVSTQIVANNGGSQDWTVSVIGNIMEYKLNRPMVYSKVNNVLDIETAYMWNGSSWVMLGEKGNYAIAVGAGDTHVRVFNRINNSFNLSQQFQSSSSSMVNEDIALPSSFSSRDGRVFLISRARVYKVYYRTGDVYTNILDIPYNKNLTLNGVTYTGVAINAVPSGNGNYIFVWYRGVPATSGSQHFSQIVVYSFNGSTYTITQESAVYQLAGTPTNTICRQLTVNNEGTACAILYMNNGGFLDVFFRDSNGIHRSSTSPTQKASAYDNAIRIVMSYDGSEIYLNTSGNTISRFKIDYVNRTYFLNGTITSIPTSMSAGGGYVRYAAADGRVYMFVTNGYLYCYNIHTGEYARTQNQFIDSSYTEQCDISISPDGTKLMYASPLSGVKYYSISISNGIITPTLLTNIITGTGFYRAALIPN